MHTPNYCPSCGESFKGEPIPEKDRPLFGNEKYFSVCIGIINEQKDLCDTWACPFCDYQWPRLRPNRHIERKHKELKMCSNCGTKAHLIKGLCLECRKRQISKAHYQRTKNEI